MKCFLLLCIVSLSVFGCTAQKENSIAKRAPVLSGAERLPQYLPLLKGKRVGIFANNTSLVGNTHLVDTLQKRGIQIVKIFAPEHGFRGTAGAGEKLGNDTDKQTGIPIISLYGKKVKPSAEDLEGIDILVFDIQDVGVRFYTYVASLQYFMEGALEDGQTPGNTRPPQPEWFLCGWSRFRYRVQKFCRHATGACCVWNDDG